MSKFKIAGVGLDTTNLTYPLPLDLQFDYVHTSINSNNDFLLSAWFEENTGTSLVTSVDFLDCKQAIVSHLGTLSKDTVDLLLVDSSCDFEKYKETLEDMIRENVIADVGIKNPESVEQLEKLKEVVDFKVVSLNLSPLEFNKEIVDWCNSKEVMIFGFNPFGGHLSAGQLIDCFTVPYLLNFSAFYSALVFLSGYNPVESSGHRDYLQELIDREADDLLYLVKKSVNKLVKPLKKAMYMSLKIEDGLVLNSGISESYYNPEEMKFSVGHPHMEFEPDENYEKSEIEEEAEELFSIMHLPEDAKSDCDTLSVILPKIKRMFTSRRIHTMFSKVGKTSLLITATEIKEMKRFFVKTLITDTNFYLISYNSGTFIFKKINTAPEID